MHRLWEYEIKTDRGEIILRGVGTTEEIMELMEGEKKKGKKCAVSMRAVADNYDC